MESHLKTGGELLEFKNKDEIVSHQQMNETCKETFQQLKIRKKHRFIVFKIGTDSFDVEYSASRTEVSIRHSSITLHTYLLVTYFQSYYRHMMISKPSFRTRIVVFVFMTMITKPTMGELSLKYTLLVGSLTIGTLLENLAVIIDALSPRLECYTFAVNILTILMNIARHI